MPRATDINQSGSSMKPEANVTDDVQQRDRDQLYALREMHIESLDRLIDEIEDPERLQALNEDDLAVRQERMGAHFVNMERAHRLYQPVCVVASNEIYNHIETRLMNAMSKIRGQIRELRKDNSSIGQIEFTRGAVDGNSAMARQFSSVIRVETAQPPKIGTFNGDAFAWPAFRDLFIAEVHNKEFEPVTKLLYLQEACIGKAAEKLGPWQPTSNNYREAWDFMMAAYNDDYHVIHGILGKLFAVERQERESHDSLSTVVDALTNAQRQLQAICPQSTNPLLDQFWIHVAKQRLPKKTLDSWEQHRNREGAVGLPTGDSFRKFLETKARGRREFEQPDTVRSEQAVKFGRSQQESGNRFRPYENSRNRADPCTSQEKSYQCHQNGSTIKCVVPTCNQSHPAWKCEAFFELALTERCELVRKRRLCAVCLNSGHLSYMCSRIATACTKCPEAKHKHHCKLCPKAMNEKSCTMEQL